MEYRYKAKVVEVYDGDTITCDIQLGFNVVMQGQKIRLYGINTPEVRGKEKPRGLIVRDYLRRKILNKDVLLQTFKDKKGKYGRFLAIVHFQGQDINADLYEQGYAVINTY